MFKKIIFITLILVLALSFGFAKDINWAKALQLSLYFYDANKCGPIENSRLEWRGACHLEDMNIPLDSELVQLPSSFISQYIDILDPDGNGCIDVSQGFHDAGDHVKFGLPQTYTAATLGWGLYEFKDAFVESGQYDHMVEILKWFSDYFLKCTYLDNNNEVVAFVYMVGEGTADHTYWGAPELQDPETCPRMVDFATVDEPASDQAAGAAAALAIMSLNYRDIDSDYADECLTKAIALYDFAKANRGIGLGDGFYPSAFDDDELSWACVWLYECTRDTSYIDDIMRQEGETYTGYLSKIIATTENTWQNIWVHCWDVVWGGVFTKLATVIDRDDFDYLSTKDKNDIEYFARWNLEYWTGGEVPHEDPADTNYLAYTPAGYGMINTWGSARYNSAAQLCALIYHKYNDRPDMLAWAQGQMEYILGENPMDRCYEVGYDETSAKHPHHRAAHGSTKNSMLDPENHKHVLWGALVGGPDSDDYHEDVTTDYVYNEVAIDYNAGFVGALAGLYAYAEEKGTPEADFPPAEEGVVEFFLKGKLEQENDERTQVTININVDTMHPPRRVQNIKARYFFDITEMVDAGQTVDDLTLEIYYDQEGFTSGSYVTINGPTAWNLEDGNNIYYYEFDWADIEVFGSRDLQFGIIASQDSNWESNWDPTNDYSRQDLTEESALTNNIPMYIGDELVYGEEPGSGTTGNLSPSVSITTPINGASFEQDADITITANASDSDGSVSLVEFYAGSTKIGEASSSPYSISWENVAAGSYTLTAVATDDQGASKTSTAVSITVESLTGNVPPTVSITSPAAGTTFEEGDNITIIASATDSDGTVSVVEFFSNGTKIGEDSTNPYSIIITDAEEGSYTITATATDNEGDSNSDSIDIEVEGEQPIGDFDVDYSIANSWDTGFQGEIILTNNSGSTISSWQIDFTFPGNQTIVNSWGGEYSQSGQDTTFTNMPWTGTINDGQSITIGFIAEFTGSNVNPTDFTVTAQ